MVIQGPPGGDLQHRGLAHADFQRDRSGAGRGQSLAEQPLEEVYPIVYLDALMVKMRDNGHIQNRAIYVVLGVNLEGQKELGLWAGQSEGAKFWLQVLTELQNRGMKDIFIACVDGLKGFPEAIEAVYPRSEVQLCIVHLVRASLNYVPWKQRKQVAADLQLIYRAATATEAQGQLEELERKWKQYPSVRDVAAQLGPHHAVVPLSCGKSARPSTPPTRWKR